MLLKTLKSLCENAVQKQFAKHIEQIPANIIEITAATQKKFGHYQCNSAMKLAKILQQPPRDIANLIKDELLQEDKNNKIPKFQQIDIAGPGFVNFTLSKQYLTNCINTQLRDPRQGVSTAINPKKVILDFSCPNIAKEMHVGHLRSTIIGDCLARVFEFLGHNVLRLNHIGDWGTQFGMLIAYLKQQYPDPAHVNLTLNELVICYREAKTQFDQDEKFKTLSQQEVVKLQGGDLTSYAIWQQICEISRQAYNAIYQLLDVQLIERGESFYNPFLAEIVEAFEEKNLLAISAGAKCVHLEGFTNRDGDPLPLMIQKSDGGYNYATTDLAAIRHRVQTEQGTWLIYITDAGQCQHFQMVFAAASKVGFYDPKQVQIDHVPFGLVLRADGKKFKTRSGDTERLIDLITTAIAKSKLLLQERNAELSPQEINDLAKRLGINAIKYADLANNRTSNYTFSYERMLQFEGNTAAFLAYAYVRIESIKRKVKININELIAKEQIQLNEDIEIELALLVCQFNDVLAATIKELLPNRLTDYLYRLAEKFHAFFHQCRVVEAAEQNSRLLLCESVLQVLQRGFNLLGLTTLPKM